VEYVKEVPNQYHRLVEETANTLVVDTMQKSEIPHVDKKDQSRETYYYTVNSANMIGVIDTSHEQEILMYHLCLESKNIVKGGQARAMKELNISMENCTGQNNNKNYVLHLALYSSG
jgi:hypothetical protein